MYIIVGAGITGLTTALALNKMGIPCKVFERAPHLNEVGAGITMAPNALKVFDWLGIGQAIRQNGVPIEQAMITDQHLKPLRQPKKQFLSDHATGDYILAIHRARLQEILYQALPAGQVTLGATYQGHQDRDGQVQVYFDHTNVTGTALLGADGLRSMVREHLMGTMPLRYSGQTCWRGVAHLTDTSNLGMAEAWGHKKRFGFAPISTTTVYWFAVWSTAQGGKDADAQTAKETVTALFQDFAPTVHRLIEATPADKIIRSDINDLARLDGWSQGRVCLLGDAAHATTPNMGQGGAQGVEDAYYIAHLLAKEMEVESAFEQFEQIRRAKVDMIVNNSWRFGQMAHSPFWQFILRWLMWATPEKSIEKQMQKVFHIDKL